MIEYNEYGDADGCTHRIASLDMDRAEAANLERVAHDAVKSLHAYIVHLDELAKLDRVRVKELEADLTLTQQHLRIAHGFINWVVKISEGGPSVDLEYLQRRAQRALMGEDRTESLPPRRPLDT